MVRREWRRSSSAGRTSAPLSRSLDLQTVHASVLLQFFLCLSGDCLGKLSCVLNSKKRRREKFVSTPVSLSSTEIRSGTSASTSPPLPSVSGIISQVRYSF
jgi:hypothetical protein